MDLVETIQGGVGSGSHHNNTKKGDHGSEHHWQHYIKTDLRNMQRYYLYNDEHQEESVRVLYGHDLVFPHAETYPAPGLLLKTMDAIDYLHQNHVTYDFLLRTNLSSLFDWPNFFRVRA